MSPYIRPADRRAMKHPTTAGELNYAISRLVDDYVENHGGITYARLNEVIGVLECAKHEIYRRIAGPYEDRKLEENGEVYTRMSRDLSP